MSNIVVTGASGFVGSNLVRKLLQTDDEIFIFIRKKSNLWRLLDVLPNLNVCYVDMENTKSLQSFVRKIKPDLVYHLATYGGYPFQQDAEATVRNNILCSVNFMQVLESYGKLKRFVNVGSSSEYGPKSRPMKEDDNLEPITSYGISKVAQTQFAQYFFRYCKLPTVTIRLFSVFGPYEEPGRLIYDIMTSLISKQSLKLSSPLPRRDFIYVDDVISAIQKVSKTPNIEGNIFNIGSGRDYSVGEVVEIASKVTKMKLDVSWGFKEKSRFFDTKTSWIADIAKAKELLGWKPTFSLEKGLLLTYQWYCKNKYLFEKGSYLSSRTKL